MTIDHQRTVIIIWNSQKFTYLLIATNQPDWRSSFCTLHLPATPLCTWLCHTSHSTQGTHAHQLIFIAGHVRHLLPIWWSNLGHTGQGMNTCKGSVKRIPGRYTHRFSPYSQDFIHLWRCSISSISNKELEPMDVPGRWFPSTDKSKSRARIPWSRYSLDYAGTSSTSIGSSISLELLQGSSRFHCQT